jgi:hypothetical protein
MCHTIHIRSFRTRDGSYHLWCIKLAMKFDIEDEVTQCEIV